MSRRRYTGLRLIGHNSDRKTVNNMETWIRSESGQIELNLSNNFQDIEIKPVDEPFSIDNPMPDNIRRSFMVTPIQPPATTEISTSGGGGGSAAAGMTSTANTGNTVEGSDTFLGSNPLRRNNV